MSQHPISISTGNFSLDISGVAGFFGGDEAVQAIQTIHLYKARRWTGWYNAPGSFAVAKCLGPIANSRFWNALFPGPNEDPETVFGIDNQSGPKYTAPQSGTVIDKTTHVTYLVTQKSKEATLSATKVGDRITRPVILTVVEVSRVRSPTRAKPNEPPTVMIEVKDHNKWLASMPILASLIASALCAYSRDWYCLAMIFLGIISNGLTCLVVGSASVVLKGSKPAPNAPRGDGLLMDDSNHVVILKGEEEDVNWVTKGKFCLEYLPKVWMKKGLQDSDPEKAPEQPERLGPEEYRGIGLCGLLLGIQSLLQVLLIPQGTLFGQVMFLSSFVTSWVYNLYLSSLEKEKIQQELLFQTLDVKPTSRFELGTRTTAAVFAALVLRLHSPVDLQPTQQSTIPPQQPLKLLEAPSIKFLKGFLPNDTLVWEIWRQHVGKHIGTTANWTQGTNREDVKKHLELLENCDTTGIYDSNDKALLKELLGDAVGAFKGYYNFLTQQPENLPALGDQAVGGGDRASGSSSLSWCHGPTGESLSSNYHEEFPEVDTSVYEELARGPRTSRWTRFR